MANQKGILSTVNTEIARAFLKCSPETAFRIADLRNALDIKEGFYCGKL